MAKLCEVAKYVRSKNAGPFWVTVDIFCDTDDAYERVAHAPALNAQAVARLYGIREENVKMFYLPRLRVVKVSFPRQVPQGAPNECDMHAGQQYVQLLDLPMD